MCVDGVAWGGSTLKSGNGQRAWYCPAQGSIRCHFLMCSIQKDERKDALKVCQSSARASPPNEASRSDESSV